MKKVLIFTPSLSIAGGRERVMANMANNLCNSFELIFVALDGNTNPFYPFDNSTKIESINLDLLKTRIGLIKKVKRIFLDIFLLRKKIKEKNDINIIIGTDFIVNVFLVIAAIGLNKKIVAQEHMTYDLPLRKIYVRKIRNIIYRNFITKVITLTSYDEARFETIGVKAICIPNALTYSNNSCSTLTSKTLLCVGRFNHQKGFDLLLEAVKKPLIDNPDWKLIIIGEGETELQILDKICQYKLSNIFIKKPTNLIAEEYINAAAFVLSSRYEGLPMVLLEAMSFGLPCISFDCKTGPREIITNMVDGILVTSGDVMELEKAISYVISDQSVLFKMGKAAVINSGKFSASNVYPKWINFLNSLT